MRAFKMTSAAQLLMLATAVGMLFTTGVLVEPASAQSEACKADMITVAGPEKFRFFKKRALEGRGSAMKNAVASWEREVRARFGEQWDKWSNARDTSFTCEPTKAGGRVIGCTISGRPCLAAASPGPADDRTAREKDIGRKTHRWTRAYAQEMARQMRLSAQRRAAELGAFRFEEARQRYAAEARRRAESSALEWENARQRALAGARDRFVPY